MKNKRLLLGAAILLSALVSCSKPDVPPITRGDPGTIVNPTRPRPVAQAPGSPLPPGEDLATAATPDSCGFPPLQP